MKAKPKKLSHLVKLLHINPLNSELQTTLGNVLGPVGMSTAALEAELFYLKVRPYFNTNRPLILAMTLAPV